MVDVIYYKAGEIIVNESAAGEEDLIPYIELSGNPARAEDDPETQKDIVKTFEKDFPEIYLVEECRGCYNPYFNGNNEYVPVRILREYVESNPRYKPGEWTYADQGS